MVDNVILPGAGSTIAADDIGGSLHQRVKISLGADASAIDAIGGAGSTSAAVQRITIATDDPVSAEVKPIEGVSSAITQHDTNTVTAGRQFVVLCTVTGNVKVKFSDSSTLTFPVYIGMTILPWKVIQVYITGTTATATYFNLI